MGDVLADKAGDKKVRVVVARLRSGPGRSQLPGMCVGCVPMTLCLVCVVAVAAAAAVKAVKAVIVVVAVVLLVVAAVAAASGSVWMNVGAGWRRRACLHVEGERDAFGLTGGLEIRGSVNGNSAAIPLPLIGIFYRTQIRAKPDTHA